MANDGFMHAQWIKHFWENGWLMICWWLVAYLVLPAVSGRKTLLTCNGVPSNQQISAETPHGNWVPTAKLNSAAMKQHSWWYTSANVRNYPTASIREQEYRMPSIEWFHDVSSSGCFPGMGGLWWDQTDIANGDMASWVGSIEGLASWETILVIGCEQLGY